MTSERIAEQADSYWGEAEAAVSGLGDAGHALLNIASGAVDMVWDRNVFEQGESFGGTEIGFARGLSASILARLLNAVPRWHRAAILRLTMHWRAPAARLSIHSPVTSWGPYG